MECRVDPKTPVIPAECIGSYVFQPVDTLPDPRLANRDQAYVLPNGSAYILSPDGTSLISLGGGGGSVNLNGYVNNPTWNGTTYVLTLPINGFPPLIIDLPIESLIKGMSFDSGTNELVLTLDSGAQTRVPLNALVVGLASETWVNQRITAEATITDPDLLAIIQAIADEADINGNDDTL